MTESDAELAAMLAPLARAIDAFLSRYVVEPRFVSRRAHEARFRLTAQLRSLEGLSEADWFPEPPPLLPDRIVQGRYRGQPTKTIAWRSPVSPAAARLDVELASLGPIATLIPARRRAPEPAPVWILVHGWLGGSMRADSLAWSDAETWEHCARCLFTLPGHGARRLVREHRFRIGGIHWPSFPTRNPLVNAVGLATATAELRQLVTWLRAQGHTRIGTAGTSIGANVVALFATTSADAERVILDRPLVRMSEPLRRYVTRRASKLEPSLSSRDEHLLRLLEAIYAPVDPLARTLVLPQDRIDLLVGREDAIGGAAAGEALAERWGALLQRFPGGHVLPLGRRPLLRSAFGKL